MVLSIILCLSFCLVGIYVSYVFDLTSGATIIAVASVVFLFSYIIRMFKYLKSKKL